jgi:hypothetical protein
VQFTRADVSKPRLPQLYTIDDRELVLRSANRGLTVPNPAPGSFSGSTTISFYAGFRIIATFMRHPRKLATGLQTFGTPLASLLKQSRAIAHVLGSPAGMVGLVGSAAPAHCLSNHPDASDQAVRVENTRVNGQMG